MLIYKKPILLILFFICSGADLLFSQDILNYSIEEVGTISVSDKMELQNGDLKEMGKMLNINYQNRVVFQQSGLNEFKKDKFSTYSRIIIETTIGTKGDYSKLTGTAAIATNELEQFNSQLKSEVQATLNVQGASIIKWHGCTARKINGRNAIRCSYSRKYKTNPPTIVEIYFFQNNDRIHKVNLEYWAKDAEIWEPILSKSIESLKINIR